MIVFNLFKNFYQVNTTSTFLDRKNNPVVLTGGKYTKFFEWGSKWKTLDDAPDSDPALYTDYLFLKKIFTLITNKNIFFLSCAVDGPIGVVSAPVCADPTIYDGSDWCGVLDDMTGPWTECLKVFNFEINNEIVSILI